MLQSSTIRIGANSIQSRLDSGLPVRLRSVVEGLSTAIGHQQANEFEMALWAVLGDLDFRKAIGLNPSYTNGAYYIFNLYNHATEEQLYTIVLALYSYAECLEQDEVQRRQKVFPLPAPTSLVSIPTMYVESWIKTIRKNTTDADCLSVAAQLEAHLKNRT
jgi:hypothetical protein